MIHVVTYNAGSRNLFFDFFDISVEQYTMAVRCRTSGPDMMYARKCHACGVSDGVLYVIGGTDEQQPVLQSECLDLRQNTAMDNV